MSTNGSPPGPPRRTRSAVERFDVIVVGGRCAGSPLATLLSRAGLRVALIEQAVFPRPTLSSHLMEADGLLFLKRLGLLEAVEETGVRFMKRADTRLDDVRFTERFPLRFDDVGGAAFLRRHLLDSILLNGAIESGADVRTDTKVVELLWDDGRVCGVRTRTKGSEARLHAPLVVGADGRSSTVASLCGSRKYNVNRNQRSYYFTFFEGADPAYSDLFVFHRWGDRMVWAGPADHGLYLVGVSPEAHEREYFRRHTERGLLAHMRACEPTAAALADARIADRISGIVKFEGYFRQATGPGWVLVGDAGHFKDPSAGRGIGDAFLQVEALAQAVVDGLGGSPRHLDRTLRRWGHWRDRRFEGHYWLATTLGEAGALPPMVPEAVRALNERGETDRFLDLFSHRSRYYDVFPLRDLGVATGRLLLSGRAPRGPLIGQTARLLAREPRRRWINRHPALASSDLTSAPRAERGQPAPTDDRTTGPSPAPAGRTAPAPAPAPAPERHHERTGN
ncbi:NAD(P)/FAD-dependent oxidoreductase [Kitasatospora sp. NPDC089509]|uniref:NAD(P)/FAD-dependent oxidoreductase n=1 Tax=Kitasatospora sp. NPDC089509 TaxID=3364079 RepID=UPI00380CE050